ncbi:MAG: mechanosensitive ion channel [Alphaproteobacteria bacterium]|nr:mechanosensitive ion channel [Alphaproteobacteria bacterium]
MDVQETFDAFREWAFDLSHLPQKLMWAGVAIVLGYLVGSILAGILKFTGRRLTGIANRRRHKDEAKSADNILLDIFGSLVRLAGLLAGCAGAAWVFGYDINKLQAGAIAVLIALVVLATAWFAGAWISTRVRRFGDNLGRHSGSGGATLFAFLASLARFAALGVGLIAALQVFGFPIASLVAVVGAAGLAIALALQDTLKAVASGVIIAVFRPYRIGDYVNIAGTEGTVADITPFTTSLNTLDNKGVTLTNDKCWGDVIVNFSAHPTRRIDQIYSIDYDDDIDLALKVLVETAQADPRVHKEPAVWANTHALASSSIDLRLRAWCSSADYFQLSGDLLRLVKQAFDRAGLTIPYPHQTNVDKHPAPAPGTGSEGGQGSADKTG